jgi:hypothetical protein
MSLAGFIATAPSLHVTPAGAEYVRVRQGVEQCRKEVDRSFWHCSGGRARRL